jgi:hypothetical protein
MKFEFDSIEELQAFLVWKMGELTTRSELVPYSDEAPAVFTTVDQAKPADAMVETPVKRKRRTKAEMQMAWDAMIAERNEKFGLKATVPADAGDTEAVASVTPPVTPAQTETPPHIDLMAYLKLCRDYIAQHGVAAYQGTVTSVGAGPDVMTFSAAERAVHAALLQQGGTP